MKQCKDKNRTTVPNAIPIISKVNMTSMQGPETRTIFKQHQMAQHNMAEQNPHDINRYEKENKLNKSV